MSKRQEETIGAAIRKKRSATMLFVPPGVSFLSVCFGDFMILSLFNTIIIHCFSLIFKVRDIPGRYIRSAGALGTLRSAPRAERGP